ncbi:hypothetical protein ACXO5C_09540, partial [Lactobacillus delbrueckii subsp. bulgaricus]
RPVSQSVSKAPSQSQSVSPLEWHRYQLVSVGTLVKLTIVSIKTKITSSTAFSFPIPVPSSQELEE